MTDNKFDNWSAPASTVAPPEQPDSIGSGWHQQPSNQPSYTEARCSRAYPGGPRPASNDSGSFGWASLGFFIPVAGLILYLVWKDEKPRNASAAGKGALVSVVVGVAFSVLSTAFASCVAVGLGSAYV